MRFAVDEPMPISALVFTLSTNLEERAAAVDALHQHPAFTVGAVQEELAPVALDTQSSAEDRACWAWAKELPGVRNIDVVHITFDGLE